MFALDDFKFVVQILRLILLVGSIVVVGRVKSTNTSAGTTESTHPTNAVFEDTVGPIATPAESQSLIVTYNSTS